MSAQSFSIILSVIIVGVVLFFSIGWLCCGGGIAKIKSCCSCKKESNESQHNHRKRRNRGKKHSNKLDREPVEYSYSTEELPKSSPPVETEEIIEYNIQRASGITTPINQEEAPAPTLEVQVNPSNNPYEEEK